MAARTMVVPAEFNSAAPLAVWVQDPSAVLDYTIDWSKWLAAMGGDTLTATPTWTMANFTITNKVFAGGITTALIANNTGVAGTAYDVVVHVATVGGRAADATFRVLLANQ